jgi:protein-S-isoprenylcysteine O-methyltransferase Ste14
MNTNHEVDKAASRKVRLPQWSAVIYLSVAGPLVHVVIPWAISLLALRHGWIAGHPGKWNWLGLIPVTAGVSVIAWCASLHVREIPHGYALETTPEYLLVKGPYKYSRNPIYLAILPIWLGWVIFYGSFSVGAVLVGLLVAWLPLGILIVGREERSLEARFGESYVAYKRSVPRWIGRRHH